MTKEQLREKMSKAIGTFENAMVRDISEACADIAWHELEELIEHLHAERDSAVNNYLDQRGLNQSLAKTITELQAEVSTLLDHLALMDGDGEHYFCKEFVQRWKEKHKQSLENQTQKA